MCAAVNFFAPSPHAMTVTHPLLHHPSHPTRDLALTPPLDYSLLSPLPLYRAALAAALALPLYPALTPPLSTPSPAPHTTALVLASDAIGRGSLC